MRIERRIKRRKNLKIRLMALVVLVGMIANIVIGALPSREDRELIEINLAQLELERQLAEMEAAIQKKIETEERIKELEEIEARVDNMILDKEETLNQLEEEVLRYEEVLNKLEADRQKIYEAELKDLELLSFYASEYSRHINRITQYKGSDFTFQDFIFLIETCESYDVPVDLMMAIMEVESNFKSYAKNPNSTASGYLQILNGTGEWLYALMELEKVYGEYTPDIRFDKEVNLMMGTYYISILRDSYVTFRGATRRYYGSTDEAANDDYANKIQNKLILIGTTFEELESSIR